MAPTGTRPKRRKKLLSNTRPPSFGSNGSTSSSSKAPSLSSHTTRTIIRRHHTMHKQLAQAERAGDRDGVAALRAQLEAAGGLAAYQQASTQGQAAERGGDSSRMLVAWFREASASSLPAPAAPLRLLEVGALRVDNACARSGLFAPTRIDLRSTHAAIAEQDFMQRPLPPNDSDGDDSDRFDVVSLSLVLNYVSEAAQRGAMLARVARFLRAPRPAAAESATQNKSAAEGLFPGLFLVLPAPCVRNSRYLDDARLRGIMAALGYECVRSKYSDKLAYFYWRLVQAPTGERFAKKEIVKGAERNNFAIVLN